MVAVNIKKKQISIINNLLTGLGIIVLGIIIIVGNINMYTRVVNLFVYIFILFGMSKLLNFLLNKMDGNFEKFPSIFYVRILLSLI